VKSGLEIAGKPIPAVTGLALEDCARRNSIADNLGEARGARDRPQRPPRRAAAGEARRGPVSVGEGAVNG
jgi:hypothetical protein